MVTPATISRDLTHVDSQRFKNKWATPPLSIFMGQVTVGYHLRDFSQYGQDTSATVWCFHGQKNMQRKTPSPWTALSVQNLPCWDHMIFCFLCVLTWSRPHNQELAENIGAFFALRCLSGVSDMTCPIGYRYRLNAEWFIMCRECIN